MSNPITPLTPEQFSAEESKVSHESYPERVAVAFDQDINVDTGGLPDETISSRAARAALKGKWWGIVLSKALNLVQKDHGALAMAGDTSRGDAVASIDRTADGQK